MSMYAANVPYLELNQNGTNKHTAQAGLVYSATAKRTSLEGPSKPYLATLTCQNGCLLGLLVFMLRNRMNRLPIIALLILISCGSESQQTVNERYYYSKAVDWQQREQTTDERLTGKLYNIDDIRAYLDTISLFYENFNDQWETHNEVERNAFLSDCMGLSHWLYIELRNNFDIADCDLIMIITKTIQNDVHTLIRIRTLEGWYRIDPSISPIPARRTDPFFGGLYDDLDVMSAYNLFDFWNKEQFKNDF